MVCIHEGSTSVPMIILRLGRDNECREDSYDGEMIGSTIISCPEVIYQVGGRYS